MHQSKPGPTSPHLGLCGALVRLFHHIGSSLSPQCVQEGGDCSRKDFWVHLGTS